MGLFDNLLARRGYVRKAEQEKKPQWLLAEAGAQEFELPDMSLPKNQSELFQRLSWVNIAITQLSQACSVQMLNVKKREGDRLVDIPNHPFEMLLDNPNPDNSRMEFMFNSVAWYKLTGNCYWWMNRPSENSAPSELWIIPSHMIKPVPDGRLFLRGYMYYPGDGSEIPLEVHEVAHFKSFNPNSRFIGLSPIESIAIVATGDMEMQKSNARLYGEDGGKLPSVLAFADNISDSEWSKMQEDIRDNEKKRKMLMLRNSGAGGVQWIANSLSYKEMEFLAGRTMTKEEIFSVFAPGLSSMLAVNATEANSTAAKETFNELAVWPVLKFISEKINSKSGVLASYGDNLYSEFDDPRKTDRLLAIQEIQEYGKTHTVNEIRVNKYDDEPLEDERGELFVTQITAQQAQPEPEEETPEEPDDTRDLTPENEPEPEEDEQDMVKAELEKWRSFEVKRKGKGRAFKCEHVPDRLERVIRDGLLFAVDEDEINAVFDAGDPVQLLKQAVELANK